MELNLTPEDVKGKKFYYGEGCDKCNNLGFKGRTGLYELLIMNDDLRDMISRGRVAPTRSGSTPASKGTPSLRDAGLRALFAGHHDPGRGRPRDGAGRRRRESAIVDESADEADETADSRAGEVECEPAQTLSP